MLKLDDIVCKLIDNKGRNIQCGEDKGATPSFLKYDEAITTAFFRFGNAYFIPALSLDIDNHKSHAQILNTCLTYELPFPTIIVDTNKGMHVHWVLTNPIPMSNLKAKYFYQQVISSLVAAFDTDNHAVPKNAGRLFRNPLKHDTKIYNSSYLDLTAFLELSKTYKSMSIAQVKVAKTTKFSHYVQPDFSKIKEGHRNNALFDYARAYAYRNHAKSNLVELLTARLTKINLAIPIPVEHHEITAIVRSIVTFINEKYVGKTKNKKTIAFNRKLCEKSYNNMQTKLLERFYALPLLTLASLRKMSLRAGAKTFGIHKNTFKKHLEELINDIKLGKEAPTTQIWVTKPVFKDAFTNSLDYKPTYLKINTS